ncbi:MAG: hypothetical protein JXR76_01555 [Deltaproteobacteria bacterium]|nr:hypothetical protein [Deltaproteobacteria bacterium]
MSDNPYANSNSDVDVNSVTELSTAEKETHPVTSDDSLNWDGAPMSEPAPIDVPPGSTLVAIDWAELEGALENNSPELHSFLNKSSGDVIRIFNGTDNAERRLQEVEADPSYVYIEPISSREQYRWMEEYIEEMEDCPLKDKLNIAVDGKGAFRRFKDVLVQDPDKREVWFAKRSEKLQAHIAEWLKAKNIVASNSAPWQEGASTRKFETVRRNRYSASQSRNFGTNLRRKSHELVDLIPSKALPIAAAFLEFIANDKGHYHIDE